MSTQQTVEQATQMLTRLRHEHAEVRELLTGLEADRRQAVFKARTGDAAEVNAARERVTELDTQLAQTRQEATDLATSIELQQAEVKHRQDALQRAEAVERDRGIQQAQAARMKHLGKFVKALEQAASALGAADSETAKVVLLSGKRPEMDGLLSRERLQTYVSREMRRLLGDYMTEDAGKPDPWKATGYPSLLDSCRNEHLPYLSGIDDGDHAA